MATHCNNKYYHIIYRDGVELELGQDFCEIRITGDLLYTTVHYVLGLFMSLFAPSVQVILITAVIINKNFVNFYGHITS